MKKKVEVEIKDFKIARNMLELSGFNARKMTEEEILDTILSMIECYGAEWKMIDDEEGE